MSTCFYNFLKTEHSSEAFDFLLEVKKLETLKDEKLQAPKASEIIVTFVEVDSQKELNLSGELRNKTLKLFEKQQNVYDKWVLDITPIQVFAECFKLVAGVLRHDSFKRFVRTPQCEKVMMQFKNDSSVISPALTNIYSYQNEYFTHPHIDDSDFDFFKSLLEDNYNWKLIGSKVEEQVNAFTSETNYLPEVRISNTIVNAVKFETILPCTFDQSLLSYFSNEMLMKSDPNCRRIRNVDYFEYDKLMKIYKEQQKENQIEKYKRDLNVCALEFALPFPFNPRFANRADSCHYDPETKTFMRLGKNFYQDGEFGKPVKVEMACKRGSEQSTMMKAYTFFLFSCAFFQKIDEKKVLYKDIVLMDLGGWGSSKMMISKIIKDRKDKFKGSILKIINEHVPETMKFADVSEKLNKEIDGKPADGFAKLLGNIDFGEY
eukprot:gene11257-4076_t